MMSAAALALVLPAVSMAQSPTAEDFEILYYTVDYADGEPRRGRQMTEQDLERFVNQARCECGQEVWARIVLHPGDYANTQLRTYVGSRCDEAQEAFNPQLRPCGQLEEGPPQLYREGLDVRFHPIWLARGVDGTSQGVSNAVAAGNCGHGHGEAGIWICVENNGQPDCQAEEFVIRGDRSANVADSDAQTLSYSFDPPLRTPSDVRVERDQHDVIVSWELEGSGPSGGYRVLCADADGNPLGDGSFEPPELTALPLGDVYFTKANLCGDMPFTEVEMSGGPRDEDRPGGIASLDWAYVCSDHLPSTTTETRVVGLDGDEPVQVVLVAYDQFGNPAVASEVLTAMPDPAFDGEADTFDEFSGRGCGCSSGTRTPLGTNLLWVLALGAAMRRRD
jgi:hypothetical protein